MSSLSAPSFFNQITCPLVSALFIHTDPEKANYATQIMQDFERQSWHFKELLLINATEIDVTPSSYEVRVIKIKARHLGELKNLAVYNAKGEWCLPLSYDCRYESNYINWHMLRRSKSLPVAVNNPVGHVVASGAHERIDVESAFFCSFYRFNPHAYDDDGDDFNFASKWPSISFSDSDAIIASRLFSDYEN